MRAGPRLGARVKERRCGSGSWVQWRGGRMDGEGKGDAQKERVDGIG